MIFTLKLKDEVYEKYMSMDPKDPKRAIVEMLEKHSDQDPRKRKVVLEDDIRAELEKIFELTLGNHADQLRFLHKVRDSMTLKLDGAEIMLNKGQRAKVMARAKFFKRPATQIISEWLTRALQSGF